MHKLVSNACFALIFLIAGLTVGVFISWAGALLVALIDAAIHGGPISIPRGSVNSEFRLFFVLAIGILTAIWLFYKKYRIDVRWGNGRYLKCLRCGYDLRGNQSDDCPECGYRMTLAQQEALHEQED